MMYSGELDKSQAPRPAISMMMRVWMTMRALGLARVPRPKDATRIGCAGELSDWVLIVGNGAARGWGVHSHNDALPGHLARAMSALTGRGTDVVVVNASSRSEIRSAILSRIDARYEGIVVSTGILDALSLCDPEWWRGEVQTLLEHLTGPTGVISPIVVVGIPSVRAISVFDTATGERASTHAEVLNAITREVCAEFPRVSYSALSEPCRPSTNPSQSSENYRAWATAVANTLVPMIGPTEPHTASSPA
jgi:hypothetical protein